MKEAHVAFFIVAAFFAGVLGSFAWISENFAVELQVVKEGDCITEVKAERILVHLPFKLGDTEWAAMEQ